MFSLSVFNVRIVLVLVIIRSSSLLINVSSLDQTNFIFSHYFFDW